MANKQLWLKNFKLSRMLKLAFLGFAGVLLFGCAATSAIAQEPPPPESAPNPSDAPAPPKSQDPADSLKPKNKPPASKPKDSATQSAPDQPVWDPLRAEKDLEVGQYYMKKGDWDAAIDRFEDATVAKPGYAIPYRFLGEAQEKMKRKKLAIKAYTRYLDLYPHAEDRAKVQKRIDKLYQEVEKDR